jgi:hypothetical protein
MEKAKTRKIPEINPKTVDMITPQD